MEPGFCVICRKELINEESIIGIGEDNQIAVHKRCFDIFCELVRFAIIDSKNDSVMEEPIYDEAMPDFNKEKDSESSAILKLLEWAYDHHPEKGLSAREVSSIFKEKYRWKLSNASARLGELLEQNKVSRVRKGRSYVYFVKK